MSVHVVIYIGIMCYGACLVIDVCTMSGGVICCNVDMYIVVQEPRPCYRSWPEQDLGRFPKLQWASWREYLSRQPSAVFLYT